VRPVHKLNRFVENAAGVGELAHLDRHIGAAGDKEQRVMAKRHDDGAGLAHIEIFSTMQAAMFSGRDVERKGVFSLQHDAISSRVDPTFVRVAGDHKIVGADIAAAVKLMPARDRKSFEIDIVLEGELVITRGTEQVRGKTGDVIYIPKGSSITFGTPNWTRFVYVVFPVNWNEK